MTTRTRITLTALVVVLLALLAGCLTLLPELPCTTDADCQGTRTWLYDGPPLTEAQMDSLLAERVS